MATEYFNDAWRIPNNKNQSLVSNYSMEFTVPTDTKINIGDSDSLTFGANDFTYAAWINPTSFSTGFEAIYVSQANPGGVWIGKLSGTGDKFTLRQTSGTTVIAAPLPALNTWTHICITRNNNDFVLYFNGSSVATTTLSITFVQGSDVYIGSYSNGASGFNGLIDQTCVFDYALPATGTNSVATLYGGGTAITNPMSLNPAPVAYYQLGDQSVSTGPSADYLVPNNSLQDYVFNFDGTDGTDDFLNCGNDNSLQATTALSISAWIKYTSDTADYRFIVSRRDSPNTNYQFYLLNTTGGSKQLRFVSSGGVNSTGSVTLNNWHHVAVTANGGDISFYIDGQPAGTGTISGINSVADKDFIIGNIPVAGSFEFAGYISNVAFWNTNLSNTDIETIYNNGSPNDISSLSPISWWKLNAQDTFDGTNWTIKDYAGSNDGTSSGMTSANLIQSNLQHTSGYSPYALSLNGTSNFFKLGTTSDSTLGGSTSFTVTAWVKPISFTPAQFQYIFGSWGGGNTTKSYNLGILTSNKIRFQLFSTDGSTTTLDSSTNEISYGVWQNITVTYDGTNLKMFKNGIEDASSVVINNKVVYNSLYADSIGRRSSVAYANYFYGDISNCAIWRNSVINPVTIYNNGVPANLNNLSTKPSYWWQLGSNSSFDANTDKWTCLNEGTERTDAAPVNAITGATDMTNDDITNGVGYSANGLGTSSIKIIGDAPYSSGNALSENMDVLDRVKDTPPT